MMKRIIALLFVVFMVIITAGCSGQANTPEDKGSYEALIFDSSRVHTIEVSLSEEDRAAQLADPTSKTKYHADVVIDGEEFKDVAFHTKGNSSLFFTADAGKDKFSYAISFNKYEKDQTFHGLDKLNLQNNFADATAMKEYMAFWLFRKMGVEAPLASHVYLTVNGEEQGLYTALEDIQDSFLKRAEAGEGTIYKPEPGDMDLNNEEMGRLKAGESAAHDSSGGADLVYKDDNEDSYPDIFENAETDEGADTRGSVIRSLKALSEGTDLEQHLDTEEIIKYFAVHNFLVNYDSYMGTMLHNYCLYENDGRLAMLPWDYDNAFGAFPKSAKMDAVVDSTEAVNAGIDSPLGDVPDKARPMWNWVLSSDDYLKKYHETLSDVTDLIGSGEFDKEAARVHDLILPYYEKDPKAFFTSERCQKAYETLLRFTGLRAESVRRQVSGRLAASQMLQAEEDKVDASEITIADMGTIRDIFIPKDGEELTID